MNHCFDTGEELLHFMERQKKVLYAIRKEQKELQTAVSNTDAILGDAKHKEEKNA